MAEVYDFNRALVEDWKTFFVERHQDKFIFKCIEGDVELTGNWAFLNIIITMPLIKRMRPVSRDKHLALSGIYDAQVHAQHMTRVARSLEDAGYTRAQIGPDILNSAMELHNACYTHLGPWIRTMDIFALADTILQDGVREVCTMDYGNINDLDIKRMEDEFKARSKHMEEVLSGKTDMVIENNVLEGPLKCRALKSGQFAQFVLSAGPRTDTDDRIILRPVNGSFLSGLCDITDMAFESRSAAKSTHYNKTQMSNTQYRNRKTHLLVSSMEHLYPGDCGAKPDCVFTPTKSTVQYYIGLYFVDKDGELAELTPERYNDVIDKPTKFRSVANCRHTDGYCETCGGTITRSFSPHGNVGFVANCNTGAPVAQQVLSTKHLISTDTAVYLVPYTLRNIFTADGNDIYIAPSIRNHPQSIVIGFSQKDISRISDLKYFVGNSELNAAEFSEIKFITLGTRKPDGTIAKIATRTPLKSDSDSYPHLSPEVLRAIRDNPSILEVNNDGVWLDIKSLDMTKPVMQCTVVNNSIRRFVETFTDFISKGGERYNSINDFIWDVANLVWTRVDTHLTHVACLSRACLVNSHKDAHIPEVDDINNVTFGNLGRTIPLRSIGALFAFERFSTIANRPQTYITLKQTGVFDHFMGYTDMIEKNMAWPLPTDPEGKPIEVPFDN